MRGMQNPRARSRDGTDGLKLESKHISLYVGQAFEPAILNSLWQTGNRLGCLAYSQHPSLDV
jgi:hypothetical protein